MSKLAIVALFAALLCSPWLLWPQLDRINRLIPPRYGYLHTWAIVGTMTLATTLSLIAVVRIRLARGRLVGGLAAWTALLLSLLWWCVPLAFILLFWL
jgi:hypothetical protein